jgi:hypothetical protein
MTSLIQQKQLFPHPAKTMLLRLYEWLPPDAIKILLAACGKSTF